MSRNELESSAEAEDSEDNAHCWQIGHVYWESFYKEKKNERIGRKVEEREKGRATGAEEAGAEHQKETKRKCYRFLLRNEKVHQVSNTTVQFPIQEAI